MNAGVAEAASCSFLCLSSLFSVLLARIAAMLSLWWLCGVIPFLHARNGKSVLHVTLLDVLCSQCSCTLLKTHVLPHQYI